MEQQIPEALAKTSDIIICASWFMTHIKVENNYSLMAEKNDGAPRATDTTVILPYELCYLAH